jgi:tetratricopeptide (TPR) repeat protein
MQKALEDAERCISLRPTWEKGYFRKGSVLEGLSRLEESLAAYREAAEYNPKNLEVANKIKSVSKMLRNSRNAQGRKAREEARNGGGDAKASSGAAGGEKGGFVKNDEEYAKAKANAVRAEAH